MANMYALSNARHAFDSTIKQSGLQGCNKRLLIFTSEQVCNEIQYKAIYFIYSEPLFD